MAAGKRGERPGKQKRIIAWILVLVVSFGLVLGLISSVLLVTAVSMKDYIDDLNRYCADGLRGVLLLSDYFELKKAWETGEKNQVVEDFEEIIEGRVKFQKSQSQENGQSRAVDGEYFLIPDGEGGYRYGGGFWYNEDQAKDFMAPASELSPEVERILRNNHPGNCILLDLKKGRESTMYVDACCYGFYYGDGDELAFYCVIPSRRALYKSVNLKSFHGVFLLTGVFSLFVYFALLMIVGFLLRRRIAVPLGNLERSVKQYVNETHEEPNPEKWNYREPKKYCQDEIGSLADSVAGMAEEMKQTTIQLLTEVKEKERRDAELDMAARIQRDALPSRFPAFPERQDFDIFAAMKPAKEVGGDFYDFFLADEDHLCIMMADVSDKGMPAALFMMMSKELIHNLAATGMSPSEVLETANKLIAGNNRECMFVTVWLGSLCLTTGHFTCANAGHPSPIIRRRNGETFYITDDHDYVLGPSKKSRYKEYEHQLEEGDLLFTYTDGVTEATSKDTAMFGQERLLTTLAEAPEPAAKPLLCYVEEQVNAFTEGAAQSDDITMLAVEYHSLGAVPGC